MFQCDRCGLCCRSLYKSKVYEHLDKGDGSCFYLDLDTNLCMIYEKRPLICRVDDAYEELFKNTYSKEKYYKLNAQGCINLKKEGIIYE